MDKVDFLDKRIGRMKKRHRFTAETQKANALDEACLLFVQKKILILSHPSL
jgi:hypothetical protein